MARQIPLWIKSDVSGMSAVFPLTLELRRRVMQLADGIVFLPPEIRQKPREQTCTNVPDLDQDVLISLGFLGSLAPISFSGSHARATN
jgi:hypothetical protein